MTDILQRLKQPLTAGMFINLTTLIELLQKQREEAADRIEADAAMIKEFHLMYLEVSEKNNEADARIYILESALREIEADCNAEYPPSHGAIKYRIRAALEGEK